MKIDTWTTSRQLKRFGLAFKQNTIVSHSLTEENKLDCVSVATSFQLRQVKEPVLDGIFKSLEKWLSHDNVRRIVGWIQDFEWAKPVSKADLHPMMVLLPIWWNFSTLFCFQLHKPIENHGKYVLWSILNTVIIYSKIKFTTHNFTKRNMKFLGKWHQPFGEMLGDRH